jgi:hypothetical protein
VDYVSLITPGSIAETRFATLTTIVDDFEDLAAKLEEAAGQKLGATTEKGTEVGELLDLMEPVRDAARAADFDHPGIRSRYRYNVSMAQEDLLAAGRAFAANGLADGKAEETLLATYEAPPNWAAPINAACDNLEAAMGEQGSTAGAHVAANADLAAKATELRAAKAQLRHLVKLITQSNPGAYAAWLSAAHVQEPPKKKKDTPPTP